MTPDVVRNLLLSILIIGTSIAIALVSSFGQSTKQLQDVAGNLWVLQGVLVTAVLTLIYRLQSDIATLANLNSIQREKLDEIVRVKSSRLWLLFVGIALSAFLPKLAPSLETSFFRPAALFISIFLMCSTTLYAFYLPRMWNELRRFLTDKIADREAEERVQAELDRIKEAEESSKVAAKP